MCKVNIGIEFLHLKQACSDLHSRSTEVQNCWWWWWCILQRSYLFKIGFHHLQIPKMWIFLPTDWSLIVQVIYGWMCATYFGQHPFHVSIVDFGELMLSNWFSQSAYCTLPFEKHGYKRSNFIEISSFHLTAMALKFENEMVRLYSHRR